MTKVELYNLDTTDPTAHHAELLLMLVRRDRLAEEAADLSAEERRLLEEADARLLQDAAAFYESLSGIDFARKRADEAIAAERWWWYLDVLAHLPGAGTRESRTSSPATAHVP